MAEQYIKRSQVTGKKYDYFSKDVVRILNIDQAAAFIKHDADLIDIYTSQDRKTGKNVLVFVFQRESTKDLYDLWCKHELE